jgi:hypothetical protein
MFGPRDCETDEYLAHKKRKMLQKAWLTHRGSHIPPDLRVYLSPDATDQFLSRRGGHYGYRLVLARSPLGEAGGRMYLTD